MAELLMRPANAILTWLCLDYHQTLWYGDNLRVLRGVGGQDKIRTPQPPCAYCNRVQTAGRNNT